MSVVEEKVHFHVEQITYLKYAERCVHGFSTYTFTWKVMKTRNCKMNDD
jgi:hypothetical protein